MTSLDDLNLSSLIKNYIKDNKWENAIAATNSIDDMRIITDFFIEKNYSFITNYKELSETLRHILVETDFKSTNPFLIFLSIYYKRNGEITDNSLKIVYNLYIDSIIDDMMLSGKSIDGSSSIIFNASLYDNREADIKYIIQVFLFFSDRYNAKENINRKSIKNAYNDFQKTIDSIQFRNDLIFGDNNIIKNIIARRAHKKVTDIKKKAIRMPALIEQDIDLLRKKENEETDDKDWNQNNYSSSSFKKIKNLAKWKNRKDILGELKKITGATDQDLPDLINYLYNEILKQKIEGK